MLLMQKSISGNHESSIQPGFKRSATSRPAMAGVTINKEDAIQYLLISQD